MRVSRTRPTPAPKPQIVLPTPGAETRQILYTETISRLPNNLLVPYYLMSSYLYYHQASSPMVDEAFDLICARLLHQWETITHPHKALISRDDLIAGSCFLRAEQFPMIVRIAADLFIRNVYSGAIHEQLTPVLLPPGQPTRLSIPVVDDRNEHRAQLSDVPK